MNQSVKGLLERWMDLDRRLSVAANGMSGGVVLSEFAESWGVDVKTVRRDLILFASSGRKMTRYPGEEHYAYSYEPGTAPIFNHDVGEGT